MPPDGYGHGPYGQIPYGAQGGGSATGVQIALISPAVGGDPIDLIPTFTVRFSATAGTINVNTVCLQMELRDRIGPLLALHTVFDAGVYKPAYTGTLDPNAFNGNDFVFAPRFALPTRAQVRIVAEGGT